MGTSGNRNCQRASRSALKDFTDDALTIPAGSLFQKEVVFKTIPRSLVVETVGMVWVLGGLEDGRV